MIVFCEFVDEIPTARLREHLHSQTKLLADGHNDTVIAMGELNPAGSC